MSQAAVLDESDEIIRAELSRLEAQRKKITASLDRRINQLRSILGARDMLPLFEASATGVGSSASPQSQHASPANQ